MSSRPWLKALKDTIKEDGADTDETPEKIAEPLHLEGSKGAKAPVFAPSAGVGVQATEKVRGLQGDEERTLIRAGWASKERCGLTIWERPDNGFYYSQEMALAIVREEAKLYVPRCFGGAA